MKNATIIGLIIGVSIIIAAELVVRNLPRYQFFETKVESEDYGVHSSTYETYVFDMVSGCLYSRTLLITYNESGRKSGSIVVAAPKRPLVDVWKKQREVFGDKWFSAEEWKSWKEEHGWK